MKMTKHHQRNPAIFINFSSLCVCVTLVCLVESYQMNGMECGTADFIRPRMLGGKSVVRGEWPFIAALYSANQSKYICGGTIISNRHVLTAANCIQPKGSARKLLQSDIVVRLGAYNITATGEEDAVQMNLSAIYVHPDWDVTTDEYDADIAILVLNGNVTFTNYIRPVCLPTDDVIIDGALIDVTGTVVGWSFVENETQGQIPRQAAIQAFNDSYCYRQDPGVVFISSARTFCGGKGDGTPSIGDSGGGFFVDSGSAWVQYGIIAASRTNGTGQIVSNSTSVYVNVKSFKDWICEMTNTVK